MQLTKHRVLMINGGPKSGKSYLANELMSLFMAYNIAQDHKLPVPVQEHHITPLHHMLFAFADSFFGKPVERSKENYAGLKDEIMLGRSGREWQICWADGMRALDPDIFPRGMWDRIEKLEQPAFVIVDDCGFPNELTYAREQNSDVKLTYVGKRIDPDKKLKHGEPFPGDNRINLSDEADYTDTLMPLARQILLSMFPEFKAK